MPNPVFTYIYQMYMIFFTDSSLVTFKKVTEYFFANRFKFCNLTLIIPSNNYHLFFTVKSFQALESKTNSFICTRLNDFKNCNLNLITLFNITNLLAHCYLVSSIAMNNNNSIQVISLHIVKL